MKEWVVKIVALVIFVMCIVLLVTGQRTVGVPHLMKMIVGLLGILALLFAYNRKYQ